MLVRYRFDFRSSWACLNSEIAFLFVIATVRPIVPVSAVGAAAAQQSLILPSVQHDSEDAVREKRPAPDSAQELPGPSVGVLPLHMIEEETAGEDGDHAEETPSSPPCSGQ